MCRTCRYIDPGPSFVFIGPPPSATRPVTAGTKARPAAAPGYPWPWPGAASPQALSRHPLAPGRHPPPAAPLATGRAQSAGAGGAPGHPRHGISSAKNESADFRGLKIDPQKSTRLQFLHQMVRRLFLGRYWKNHGDRTNTSKDIHKKHEGRAESAPPFQCAC